MSMILAGRREQKKLLTLFETTIILILIKIIIAVMRIFEKIKEKLNFIPKLSDLFSRKEKIQFLGVLGTSLLTAVFQAVGIASILPFINIVMDPGVINENMWLNYFFNLFNFGSTNSFLVFFGCVVLIFLIVGNLISAFSAWLKINFVWRKNHSLSSKLLEKYLSMPYVYFLEKNTADLGKNVLAEVQQLTSNFMLPIIKIISDVIVIIVVLLLLLFVNPLVTIIAVFSLAFSYVVIFFYYSEKLKTGGKKRIEKNAERFKASSEALSGVKDIKILGVERYFLDRFCKNSDEFSSLQSWYQAVGQLPRYIMEVIAFGGIVSFLIFLILTGSETQKIIPLISFFAFAGYRLLPALQDVFNSLSSFKFNKAILDKIHGDMIKGNELRSSKLTNNKKSKSILFKKEILLEKVDFAYPGKKVLTLNNINLKIKKDSFVAVIGVTGSGKTTLIDLILGLFSPDNGSIKIDGVELVEKNIRGWQNNLGYVPQQIYLSDDTVIRNIAFGLSDEEIDIDQVRRVSEMANLNDFIDNELQKGYDTEIGERGIRLSGGQRQRIGIARALYHDPQVLIFDEATSSLDNETEKEVLKAINKVAKLKTMIVIAHRLTTVKNCDKVYVVDKGRIIDEGSYEVVVNKKRHFIK